MGDRAGSRGIARSAVWRNRLQGYVLRQLFGFDFLGGMPIIDGQSRITRVRAIMPMEVR